MNFVAIECSLKHTFSRCRYGICMHFIASNGRTNKIFSIPCSQSNLREKFLFHKHIDSQEETNFLSPINKFIFQPNISTRISYF